MNVITLIFLVTAFICFESAITVFRLNRRSRTNRLYAATTLAYTIFSVVYVQMLLAPDIRSCWGWYRVFATTLFLVFTLTIHYLMELTRFARLARSRVFLAMLYGAGFAMVIMVTVFAPVVSGFARTRWGWSMVYDIGSPWTWIAFNYPALGLILASVALAWWRKTTPAEREKKQAGVLLRAGAATIVLTALQNTFPFFLTQEMQTLVGDAYHQMLSIVFLASVRYAIWKYKLMTIIPANPAAELFAGMSDAIFLTNCRGDIVFMNGHAQEMTRQEAQNRGKKSIFGLFGARESFRRDLEEIVAGRSPARPLTLSLGEDGHASAVELSLHGVRNEGGECIGTLAIAREQAGLGEMQNKHGLSGRELEVLLLLSDGLSAAEIAGECEVALQTAKSHIHNIYRKTGLKNRVEIANLLNRNI
jgi:DNA-binding CsgD family transcriptional regulator/PAS domain-containing protein